MHRILPKILLSIVLLLLGFGLGRSFTPPASLLIQSDETPRPVPKPAEDDDFAPDAESMGEFDSFVQNSIRQTSLEQATEIGAQPEKPKEAVPDREQVRSLVVSMFPNLGEDEVDGWVDSYTGLPSAQISELLNQRQMMGDVFGGSQNSGSLFSPTTSFSKNAPEESGFQERNAANAKTLGFRQTVMLRTPGSDVNDLTLTDLSAGPKFITGEPLDISLDDAGGTWIYLQDHQLTRFGRLQILSDQRLGIRIDDQQLPLHGLPAVPENCRVTIDDKGHVLSSKEGVVSELGKITVVRLSTSEVESRDGVVFRARDPQPLTPVSASFSIGSLEGSNVR